MSKKTNTSFIYIIILLILLSLGSALFLRSSAFAITTIDIEGVKIIPVEDIKLLADEANGQNLFLFDQESLNEKVRLHPLVENVEFQRDFPHKLIIQITERKPSALVVVPNGVIEVDQSGIFLRRLESWPDKDYPVVSGVHVSDTSGPGDSINDETLKEALNLIGQAPNSLIPLIGEVNVNSLKRLTLYLTSGVEVRLGQSENWKTKLMVLLDLLNDKGYQNIQNGVKYIDFTAAKPVIGRE